MHPPMPNITRIQTSPDMVEQVRARVLAAICDGSLAPGARLTQEELAASLDVMLLPVDRTAFLRYALHILARNLDGD